MPNPEEKIAPTPTFAIKIAVGIKIEVPGFASY